MHLNIENNQNILHSEEKQLHYSDNNLKLLKISNLSVTNPNFNDNDFNINDNKFNSENVNSNIPIKSTYNNSTDYSNSKIQMLTWCEFQVLVLSKKGKN